MLCNLREQHSYLPAEVVLWVWVAALALEECKQCYTYSQNNAYERYFKEISNQMDILMIVSTIPFEEVEF